MLNGIDPIIIFHFPNRAVVDWLGDLTGASGEELDAGTSIASRVGLPIPIPLNENFTRIVIDNETRQIHAKTIVDPTTEKDAKNKVKPPKVSQTSVASDVNISMRADQTSIMTTVLIALMEMIVSRLVTQEYSISYMNGPTVIFNGLLQSFSTTVDRNTTMLKIDITLSNAKEEKPTKDEKPEEAAFKVPNRATIPGLG